MRTDIDPTLLGKLASEDGIQFQLRLLVHLNRAYFGASELDTSHAVAISETAGIPTAPVQAASYTHADGTIYTLALDGTDLKLFADNSSTLTTLRSGVDADCRPALDSSWAYWLEGGVLYRAALTYGASPSLGSPDAIATLSTGAAVHAVADEELVVLSLMEGGIELTHFYYDGSWHSGSMNNRRFMAPAELWTDVYRLGYSAAVKRADGRVQVYLTDWDGAVRGVTRHSNGAWSDIFTAIPADLSAFYLANAICDSHDRVHLCGQFVRTAEFDTGVTYNLVPWSDDGVSFSLDRFVLVSQLGYRFRLALAPDESTVHFVTFAGRYSAAAPWQYCQEESVYLEIGPDEILGANGSVGGEWEIRVSNSDDSRVEGGYLRRGAVVRLQVGDGSSWFDLDRCVLARLRRKSSDGYRAASLTLINEGVWRADSLSYPFYLEMSARQAQYSDGAEDGTLYNAPLSQGIVEPFWADLWGDESYHSAGGLWVMSHASGEVKDVWTADLVAQCSLEDYPVVTQLPINAKLYGWSRAGKMDTNPNTYDPTPTSCPNDSISLLLKVRHADGSEEELVVDSTDRFPQTWAKTVAGSLPIVLTLDDSVLTVGDQLLKVGMRFTCPTGSNYNTTFYPERIELPEVSMYVTLGTVEASNWAEVAVPAPAGGSLGSLDSYGTSHLPFFLYFNKGEKNSVQSLTDANKTVWTAFSASSTSDYITPYPSLGHAGQYYIRIGYPLEHYCYQYNLLTKVVTQLPSTVWQVEVVEPSGRMLCSDYELKSFYPSPAIFEVTSAGYTLIHEFPFDYDDPVEAKLFAYMANERHYKWITFIVEWDSNWDYTVGLKLAIYDFVTDQDRIVDVPLPTPALGDPNLLCFASFSSLAAETQDDQFYFTVQFEEENDDNDRRYTVLYRYDMLSGQVTLMKKFSTDSPFDNTSAGDFHKSNQGLYLYVFESNYDYWVQRLYRVKDNVVSLYVPDITALYESHGCLGIVGTGQKAWIVYKGDDGTMKSRDLDTLQVTGTFLDYTYSDYGTVVHWTLGVDSVDELLWIYDFNNDRLVGCPLSGGRTDADKKIINLNGAIKTAFDGWEYRIFTGEILGDAIIIHGQISKITPPERYDTDVYIIYNPAGIHQTSWTPPGDRSSGGTAPDGTDSTYNLVNTVKGLPAVQFAAKPYSAFNFEVSAHYQTVGKYAWAGLVGLARDAQNYVAARYRAGTLELIKVRAGVITVLDSASLASVNDFYLWFSHRDGRLLVRFSTDGNWAADYDIDYLWLESDGTLCVDADLIHVGTYSYIDVPRFRITSFNAADCSAIGVLPGYQRSWYEDFPTSGTIELNGIKYTYTGKGPEPGTFVDRGPTQVRAFEQWPHVNPDDGQDYRSSGGWIEFTLFDWLSGPANHSMHNGRLFATNGGYNYPITDFEHKAWITSSGAVVWLRHRARAFCANTATVSCWDKAYITTGLLGVTPTVTGSTLHPEGTYCYLDSDDKVTLVDFQAANSEPDTTIRDLIDRIGRMAGLTPAFPGDYITASWTLSEEIDPRDPA